MLGIITFFASQVWLYLMFMWYPVSGSWCSKDVRGRLTFMVWVSNWTSHWFVTLRISAPYLPQYILKTEQIISQKIRGWFNISIPPLEDFPGYMRWPDQAIYFWFLFVLHGLILVDSRGLTVHLRFPSNPKTPLFFSNLISISYLISHVPIPTYHQSTYEIYLISPSQRDLTIPLEHYFLLSFSGSVNSRMLTLYN